MKQAHPRSVTLWVIAVAHEEAAGHLMARIDRGRYYAYVQVPTVLFLYCRSIELALKAYLIDCGLTTDELRKTRRFGHHIAKLYAEAKIRKFGTQPPFTPSEEETLQKVSASYSDKSYEYPEHTYIGDTPPLADLAAVCRKVVFAAEQIFPMAKSDRLIRASLERRQNEK